MHAAYGEDRGRCQHERGLWHLRTGARLNSCGGSIFRAEQLVITRFGRVLDRAGYARFRRWRVYAERGLGGEPVAVWLYAEQLTLVYRDEPLAQYRVAYQPDQRRLKAVTLAQLFETPHRSPQLPLRIRGEDDWLPALRLPAHAPRRVRPSRAVQPPLFPLEEIGT